MRTTLPNPRPEAIAAEPEEFVACYLCGGGSFRSFMVTSDRACGTPGRFHQVRCDGCGLVLLNPRLPRGQVSGRYPDDYVSHHFRLGRAGATLSERLFERALWRGECRRVAAVHRRHPLTGRTRILDIGCGNATFLFAAHRTHHARTTGVEPDPACSRRARETPGLHVVQAPFDRAELDGSFDVITMWHYLEHDYDPLETLRRCRALLAPGGILVVQVPNVQSLTARLFGPNWGGWDAPRHTIAFSPKTLAAMLKRAGFGPPEMRPTLNTWAVLIGARLWLGLGLRIDPASRFLSLAAANALSLPLELASRFYRGGEWITSFARLLP